MASLNGYCPVFMQEEKVLQENDDLEDDKTIARKLLDQLSDVERKAIALYYTARLTETEIEMALELRPGSMAKLKMELRKRFFAALAARRRLQGLDGTDPRLQ
jgi:DNA-directed RNA polymerase specialized sigma subunit